MSVSVNQSGNVLNYIGQQTLATKNVSIISLHEVSVTFKLDNKITAILNSQIQKPILYFNNSIALSFL